MNDAPPRQPPTQLTQFFDWIRSTGIDRGHDRWFAGVCGGIAHRTGLDPLIIRGIAVVVAILGGPIFLAYAIGWALLPDATGRIHAEQAFRGVFEPVMIAIGAMLLVTFIPFARGLWWQGPPLGWGMPDWLSITLTVAWTIALVSAVFWLIIFLLRRTPAPDSAFRSTPPAAQQTTTPAPPPPYDSRYSAPAPPAAPAAAASVVPSAVVWESTIPTVPAPTMPEGVPAASGAPAAGQPGAVPPPPAGAPQRSAWDALVEPTNGKKYSHPHHDHRNRPRHPGAGFTAILLGIALTAGAISAAAYSGVFSGGAWSVSALLIGLSFALGILALGIIVSGVRGRDSGALGGFAFLAAVTLLVVGVFQPGTQLTLVGSPEWTVSAVAEESPSSYVILAGDATLDAGALDTAPRGEDRVIDVWMGAGQTELILPDNRPVLVEVNALVGGLEYDQSVTDTGSDIERGGVLLRDVHLFNDNDTRPVATIRVWTLAGQVTVTDDAR